MTSTTSTIPETRRALAHERRVCRVLDARGQGGLGETLVRLDGTLFGDRYRFESLYAAGGEGAVFLCRDLTDPLRALVAKMPLVPYHRGVELSSNYLRRRRESLREEARNLETSATRFMPASYGLSEFVNPLLDASRGGEFTEREPVLVMERMPGFDLDLWLARVHRSDIPVHLLRRNLDRVAVILLTALVDLQEHGFYYADLRPGNLRMMGRPERFVRLLDAGSLVEIGDESGKFPHVPAYLPAALFKARQETGAAIVPDRKTQAIMAGRTLYEVATGKVPLPGQEVDREALKESDVSAPVADVVDGLATGSFEDVRPALKYLTKRATKKVSLAIVNTHGSAAQPHTLTIPSPAEPQAAPARRETLEWAGADDRTDPVHVVMPKRLTPRVPQLPPEPRRPVTASDPVVDHVHAPAPARVATPLTLFDVAPEAAKAAHAHDVLPPSRPWWKKLFGIR